MSSTIRAAYAAATDAQQPLSALTVGTIEEPERPGDDWVRVDVARAR